MFSFRQKRFTAFAALMAMAVVNMFVPPARVMAADHAESTSVATDPGADIGDVFAFLDPTNNSNVILATTVEGFIVPAEGLNLGYFNPDILFRFEIENTGDAIPDQTCFRFGSASQKQVRSACHWKTSRPPAR